jgi:alkaline phosphatase D
VIDIEQPEIAPLIPFEITRMFMLEFALCLAACSAIAAASWDENINYGSPSLGHAPLGIDTKKVKKRMYQKRDGSYPHATNVRFTHGVASV